MSRRVLVVDDDEGIRLILEVALSGEGFEVRVAEDGTQALQIVEGWRPDLILLDLRMPGMDGWQFARAYQSQFSGSAPIIVLSAARETLQHGQDIHAAGALEKPFELFDLLATVDEALPGARPA